MKYIPRTLIAGLIVSALQWSSFLLPPGSTLQIVVDLLWYPLLHPFGFFISQPEKGVLSSMYVTYWDLFLFWVLMPLAWGAIFGFGLPLGWKAIKHRFAQPGAQPDAGTGGNLAP